jgi:site-specific DNA recombinase
MDDLDTAGVHFRSATEPFDTASPAGRLFVQMLGAFAEFEREVIIDRVINGMERKAANGEWTHGPRPYGYLLDPTTQHLVPHPEERHVVRDIFTTYADTRAGTRAIADRLNAQGKRTRKGKPWSGHTIGRMLTNRLYLGFLDVTVPAPTLRWLNRSCSSRASRFSPPAAKSARRGPPATPTTTSPA